jgi:hypothetical protein
MHQVVAMDSANLGPAHPYLASHPENFGVIYSYAGFHDSNVALLKQVLAMRRAVLADDNPAIGRTLYDLALADYLRKATPPPSRCSRRRWPACGGRTAGALDVVWTTAAMGRNQYHLGRWADAERNLRWALKVKDPNGRLAGRDLTPIAPVMARC